ncbi:periphilin-1-like [Mugil cephalus]|uniref:periphilin-1-like n=1 Tax=Mugil cephalus TaxID=48193 RepID=UPI001FB76D79|nr:periphilin-1-like [Mugil cephalus]XP_047452121.1 periphilin-1-like [Mugil cephalus]
MAYRRGPKSIREAYEDHFSPQETREVTVHRVVNIVERRSPKPRPVEFDRGYNDDEWYGVSRDYPDMRGCHGEGSYVPSDRRYFDDDPSFGSFRRNFLPPQNDSPYSQQSYSRDDLRHYLGSRKSSKSFHFRSRGRGSGPSQRSVQERKTKEDRDYRSSQPSANVRDRSPVRREAQSPVSVRSASSTNKGNTSPDRDKGYNHQQPQQKAKHKPNVTSHTPSSSVEGSPHSSGSSKEKTSASVAESEEAAAASMEPKLTPVEDIKARRLEAIKAKALEIEKHYRQDCETFRTVVKMLVDKEPSLDNLLQAPLDDNLSEIKQRCLDALRIFVNELDEVLEKPKTST